MLINIISVGVGGALGAILRFGVNKIFESYLSIAEHFGTLFINIIGCFLIGFIIGLSLPNKDTSYYFFIVGFLGSFTTMSTFTFQTISIANTNLIYALSYIILTVVLTILATYIGIVLAR